MYLSETALCVSGRYPEQAHEGGEEGCSFSSQRSDSQKREGQLIAHIRCGHQRSDPTEGWGMAAGGEKEKNEDKEGKKGSCALYTGT